MAIFICGARAETDTFGYDNVNLRSTDTSPTNQEYGADTTVFGIRVSKVSISQDLSGGTPFALPPQIGLVRFWCPQPELN